MFVYNEPFILYMIIDAAGFAHNYLSSHISAWEIWFVLFLFASLWLLMK
jgi:hypothetical protein